MDPSLVADAMRKSVPWVQTNGVEFTEVGVDRVVAALPDRPESRNHVGGPHAAMLFGVGETASGAVVMAAFGGHLDRATPLVARAEIAYRKLALGPLTAEAVLERPAADVVAELEGGQRPEFPVRVSVRDAEGVVTTELVVTWTLKPQR
ncbi:DUF4442 domain-containing protein [Actinosynnema pretiosum subsp. pretiosum]|uniref:DUF4442 domain-containing protein n=2 Tax=Actinosynnema TaxID=40566 RepID=C6WGF7_ACTMD|nr:DUF4442 domain-containing protein [Actinosynnema mirum]ACU34273.1 hypothetical protein Amir_0304 [Actinosynnema mirum DSM 43827]QUF01651.1 DUF4442 domain-containing protein [Actinosynnema pretiosum subsp. pretiosum]